MIVWFDRRFGFQLTFELDLFEQCYKESIAKIQFNLMWQLPIIFVGKVYSNDLIFGFHQYSEIYMEMDLR